MTAAAASTAWTLKSLAAVSGFRGRFAICNETFGDMAFDKAFQLAAECGYEAIEIAPFTIANDVNEVPAERRREIRRQIEAAGLQDHRLALAARSNNGSAPDEPRS